MELLISNGDFEVDQLGRPIEVYSIDEACQRVRLILSTRRGEFIYNRSMGADFSSVSIGDEDADKKAQLICREALAEQKEISIGSVCVKNAHALGKFLLEVEVFFGGQSKNTEVYIFG